MVDDPKPQVEEKAPQAVEPVKTEVKEEIPGVEEKPVEIPQENWRGSPLFYELTSYLGVDSKDYENAAEKISLITDWAITEGKSSKVEDILVRIRGLEDKLMKPTWGETRYGNLYRYLRLAVKRDAFDKALSAFENRAKK